MRYIQIGGVCTVGINDGIYNKLDYGPNRSTSLSLCIKLPPVVLSTVSCQYTGHNYDDISHVDQPHVDISHPTYILTYLPLDIRNSVPWSTWYTHRQTHTHSYRHRHTCLGDQSLIHHRWAGWWQSGNKGLIWHKLGQWISKNIDSPSPHTLLNIGYS